MVLRIFFFEQYLMMLIVKYQCNPASLSATGDICAAGLCSEDLTSQSASASSKQLIDYRSGRLE